MISEPICLRVKGPFACFTRPEFHAWVCHAGDDTRDEVPGEMLGQFVRLAQVRHPATHSR